MSVDFYAEGFLSQTGKEALNVSDLSIAFELFPYIDAACSRQIFRYNVGDIPLFAVNCFIK